MNILTPQNHRTPFFLPTGTINQFAFSLVWVS